ncbi:MAG: FHA domain-containing protein [Myxococcales bacterium]
MAKRIYATIGRASDNDVVLDHPTVSNHHARLSWSGTSLIVEDLSSANGTFVDGQRVRQAKTRPGAEITIGEVVLPWSHEGLRVLLKAGVGARTLVMPAMRSPSFVCGNCGHVGQLAAGPVPKELHCPACKATLRTDTKPRGNSVSPLLLTLGLVVIGGLCGAAYQLASSGALGARPESTLATASEAKPPVEPGAQPSTDPTVLKLTAAIDPMDPVTRNTAVKIAARNQGPFHVEQVAEIWAAVRQRWRYVNDPEGREYFATAKETIENGYVGDCDDFAITLVSMITAIGGKARVIMMDGPKGGHAYAEACVQGEAPKVAKALITHYKTRFKQYISGKVPSTIAYRSSEECPIWLNLDWNSSVPGGAYEPELWAIAVYEGGRSEQLTPANPPVAANGEPATQATTHAQEPAP